MTVLVKATVLVWLYLILCSLRSLTYRVLHALMLVCMLLYCLSQTTNATNTTNKTHSLTMINKSGKTNQLAGVQCQPMKSQRELNNLTFIQCSILQDSMGQTQKDK